ncbi:MAG: hypothetical protein KDD69_13560 [Bdellovibrionales bacterium]|nr:hypothetical protein [Bdellovibrionales bacterium]
MAHDISVGTLHPRALVPEHQGMEAATTPRQHGMTVAVEKPGGPGTAQVPIPNSMSIRPYELVTSFQRPQYCVPQPSLDTTQQTLATVLTFAQTVLRDFITACRQGGGCPTTALPSKSPAATSVTPPADSKQEATQSTAVTGGGATTGGEATPGTLPFAEKVRTLLLPNDKGQIYEDQLQYAIVSYQLYQKDVGIEKAFQSAFSAARANGNSIADATQQALQTVVTQGGISDAEAAWVNGLSFRAAQVDSDLGVLGSAGVNPRLGVTSLESALTLAEATLAGIQAGGVEAKPRGLFSPSMSASISEAVETTGAVRIASGSESYQFLWKPESEQDGNLVVLFPPHLTGAIQSAGVYRSDSGSAADLLEAGRFSGDTANGGRAHFRFTKPGAAYAGAKFVIATLEGGERVGFPIQNPGARISR